MAIARVQNAGSTSSAAGLTLACSWPSATTAGNLLVLGVSVAANSLSVTLTPPSGWTLIDTAVTALSGANPITTTALYYKKNAASESGSKTFTFSQSVNASMFLMEISGCDISAPLDQTSSNTQTGSATLVSGTTAATGTANEIAVAVISINSNFTLTTPTNTFTLQDTQKSGSAGTARISGGLLYKIVSATGTQSTGVTASGTNPSSAKIATFKIASGGSAVQWTSTGSAAGPLQFPLGPPDMTGAITITDTTPSGVFTPTHPGDAAGSGLRNGVDYIIDCPVTRSRQLKIVNGGNVYVPKLLITFGSIADGEMVYISGGTTNRIVHFDTVWLNNNGLQCDAFKTHGSSSGRNIQIRVCKVEKLIGQGTQVHADLMQVSAGIGDLWVEDFTGYTTYDGFMMQREANIEQQTTYFSIDTTANSGATVSGANYVFKTTATHTFVTGDPVAIWNVSPSQYNGGYTVLSATSNTFTVKKGDSTPATGGGGRVELCFFAYDVGSINFNRVNVTGFYNALSAQPSNQAIRFGARNPPTANAGNPGTTTGYVHQNEDQTPFNIDQWNGTLTATNWYGEPDAGDVGGFVEPDEGTTNYSGARPVQHAAAGGQPAYCDWPSHPGVTSGTKFQQGPAVGGDFVTIQGGLPTARIANTGGSGVTVKAATQDAAMSAGTASANPVALDEFTRTVGAGGLGTANVGGTYTLTGTAADFSVNGTAAVIAVTAAAQTKRAVLASVSMRDQYATATMQTDTAPAGAYTALDVYLRYIDANNYYRCRVLLNTSGSVQVQWDRNLASVLTTIKAAVTTPLTVATATDYTILATAIGATPTVLSAYVWAAANPPPFPIPYQATINDSSSALQVVSAAGVGAALNTGSTATATKINIARWDVTPTRMSSTIAASVRTSPARISTSGSVIPTGQGSKRVWIPRS